MKNLFAVLIPYAIGTAGGMIFYVLGAPLAWILGPMTFLIIWRSFTKWHINYTQPSILKNLSLSILGSSFGLSFTIETFKIVTPYIFPFILQTILLIGLSILNAIIISKIVNIDYKTSIFASIPGGLTEMVTASESLHANASLVTIFQTVRLLTVVFFVPYTILHMFETSLEGNQLQLQTVEVSIISYGWFFLAFFIGYLMKSIIPASYVIGPLLTIALLNILGVNLPVIPNFLLIFAQITIGIGFGLMITIRDLKLGGKYCGLYFLSTVFLIAASMGAGYLFTLFSTIDLGTAMLSLAPGGLVEMVLTASTIGANPAIVSSLQFIRLLFIISIVPSLLKYLIQKIEQKTFSKE
ncbi:AbrB family transcriptional regulator [Metabacillus malikii]|uniref:Membrane AbrB-like protein n=1 Tax=Metabacillus malikii TaxID=1504265 RepID=A0ABT9ZGC5_9BACI|nr:AbrB family transcriptional regulator [Metabacillus malikii]MDQ0231339.1 membrane AbrB-like protein [Metabacillus malikii]